MYGRLLRTLGKPFRNLLVTEYALGLDNGTVIRLR